MFRLLTALLILMIASSGAFAQTTRRKPKGKKVPGISDLYPLTDRKLQMKWYVKWMVRDKLNDWYLRQFTEFLKEEQDPWKKALDKEEFSKKPREQYVKYYKSHVKWFDDMHACVDTFSKNKMAILPIMDSIQPVYVKKRTDLESANQMLLITFRDLISKKPRVLKKSK